MTGKLLTSAGASFSLIPVPDLTLVNSPTPPDSLLVDVELVSPDRFVRYLGRRIDTTFLLELADMYLSAAEVENPEELDHNVGDEDCRLVVEVEDSSPFDVTLKISIDPDIEGDAYEFDAVMFDVTRAALITAAHEYENWHKIVTQRSTR
ncbi:hypothetical protein ACPYO6_01770 [Georgenia sp. Z1344]|uniref:hypothetical protein n=1 Tax=Georgenia sp. Z1344 TaxID=3416706 RepID=UPI003CF843A5